MTDASALGHFCDLRDLDLRVIFFDRSPLPSRKRRVSGVLIRMSDGDQPCVGERPSVSSGGALGIVPCGVRQDPEKFLNQQLELGC